MLEIAPELQTMPSPSNPLGLELGQKVKWDRHNEVKIAYDSEGEKKVFKNDVHWETGVFKSGIVIGVVKKALGTYQKGETFGGWNGLEPSEYVEPYLKVSKYIYLYEVKFQLKDKPVLILPEDLIFSQERIENVNNQNRQSDN